MQKLTGIIRPYAWGGANFIAELLGRENHELTPMAEYWLGTHPGGMAVLEDGSTLAERHGDLPFLFKVLDVKDMLSIQMHPSLEQAQAGFAREEADGRFPVDHFERVFRDPNHKPELMVALSPFYLVQGFKTSAEIETTLLAIPEFQPLLGDFQESGLSGMLENWMRADQEKVNEVLKPLGRRIKPKYQAGEFDKDDIHFWAARAYLTFNQPGRCDRGIFLLYLMNLVHLNPWEAVFQFPGQLHAYLEGQNVECMATSDNVVRGGLTQKAINIEALMQMVHLQPTEPVIYHPTRVSDALETYQIPDEFSDFRLLLFDGKEEALSAIKTPLIVFCYSGSFMISSKNETMTLAKGESLLLTSADFPSAVKRLTHSGKLLITGPGQDHV